MKVVVRFTERADDIAITLYSGCNTRPSGQGENHDSAHVFLPRLPADPLCFTRTRGLRIHNLFVRVHL